MLPAFQQKRWNNLCHDMRTPLTAILGISQILLTPHCPPHKQNECVVILRDSAAMLKALVDNMLDYAKLEAGKMELIRKNFNPEEVLHEAARIASVEAEAKGLRFQTKIGPMPPELAGDALRLKQIVLNLLSNAVKFTPQGHVRLEAEVKEHDFVTYEMIIRVTDSGIGIAPERLERIFDRFAQADRSISQIYGGSGIGLALSRELARMMGGDLTVESVPEEGCRFTVILRLHEASIRLAA